jgi:hypothetical protein
MECTGRVGAEGVRSAEIKERTTCPIASSRVHEAGWTTPTLPRSPADGADFPPVAIVGAGALDGRASSASSTRSNSTSCLQFAVVCPYANMHPCVCVCVCVCVNTIQTLTTAHTHARIHTYARACALYTAEHHLVRKMCPTTQLCVSLL